jgi:tetratricopeptide (TPR) repeat protein
MALAIVERELGLIDHALTHLRRAVSIKPDSTEARVALGIVYIDRDDVGSAINEFESLLALEPDNVEASVRLGSLYTGMGEFDKAARHYRKAIEIDPFCGDANYGLASLGILADAPADVARVESALRSPKISEPDKILLGFALGRTFEVLGRYDDAFVAVQRANRTQRSTISYSIDEQESMFDRHIGALNQSFIDYCQSCCVTDETPILVMGMPRSGTSLVEQILASHPTVHGAGEVEHTRRFAEDVQKMTGKAFPQDIDSIAPPKLRELGLDYVRSLKRNAGSAQRIVDKLPHNFLRIGLFAALLPNAKIILCERDPIDNCVSIFQHPFTGEHGYATDLVELGLYYNMDRNIIAVWEELRPNQIYRVAYERLVEDAEAQTRKLLQYCGLPFHEDCLSFHETIRYVNSPSAGQIRQSIHSNSLGRGDRYRKHLQPLVDALAKRLPTNRTSCEDRST